MGERPPHGPRPRAFAGALLLACALSVVGLAASLAGCEREKPPPGRRIQLVALDCAELRADGACEVDPQNRQLSLWLPESAGSLHDIEARLAGKRFLLGQVTETLAPASTPVEGGVVLAMHLPEHVMDVEVRTSEGVAQVDISPFDTRVAEIKRLRSEGKLDEALAGARAMASDPDPQVSARGQGLVARIHLSQGRFDEAIAGLRASLKAAEQAGLLTSAGGDRIALADTLLRAKHDLSGARQALTGVDARVPEKAAEAIYERGLIERASGNARLALDTFEEGGRKARQFGMQRLGAENSEVRAMLLSELGRFQEALEELRRTDAHVPNTPCSRAHRLANTGWVRLMAAIEGAGVEPAPEASLSALELYRGACPLAWAADSVTLDLAMAQALKGKDDEALATLREVKHGDAPSLEIEAWRKNLEGKILHRQGRHREALARYDEMDALGGGAAPPAHRYRSQLGRGLALRALGEREAAVQALEEAEKQLERQQRQVPVGDERTSFLGIRQDAAFELTDLLLELGEARRALDVVRRARGRNLESAARADRLSRLSPEARARWESALERLARARAEAESHAAGSWRVPESELAAYRQKGAALAHEVEKALDQAMAVIGDTPRALEPLVLAPGEAVLTAHPVRNGWAALMVHAEGLEVHRFVALDLTDEAALGEALLAPFAAALRAAKTLRVLSGGDLEQVPVHALPFEGAPLLEHMGVVYALDVSTATRGPAAPSANAAALLVINPRADLPLAEQEAELARTALESTLTTTTLRGKQASLPSVVRALPGASWFHFAGHGRLGNEGVLTSSLALAEGKTLQLSDILVLPRAPEFVVLSACEGARADRGAARTGAVAGFGHAHAFVLAGSAAVLAPSDTIPDRVALAMSRALYAPPFSARLDAEAFRRAALSLRGSFPREWSMVRLIVP